MKLFLRSLGLLSLYITTTYNPAFSTLPVTPSFAIQPFTFLAEPRIQIAEGSYASDIQLSGSSDGLTFGTSANPDPANGPISFDTSAIMSPVSVGETINNPAATKDMPTAEPAARSCACEVLKVNSKNQRNLRIVVLVEKTSIASESDRALVRQLLEKEKRYMKYFFYEEMRTLSNMVAPTDCQTLYKKLHSAATGLQLYQVLDADIKQQL